MALSGINLAPALAGQEAVWQRVSTGPGAAGTGRAAAPLEAGAVEPTDPRRRFTVTWG